MSDNTKIEWADATVNAINGCSVTSPGCTHCYAMKLAGTRMRDHPTRQGLTVESKAGPVWNGEVRLHEPALLQPLSWTKPRRIFWNAHGDTFHENVPDEWIDRIFAVAALTPQHTHMILTKRAKRMREYMAHVDMTYRVDCIMEEMINERIDPLNRRSDDLRAIAPDIDETWPLPNVWLGVSVEDQTRADERIPDLLATPAAVRFLSCEPLLGPVNLTVYRDDKLIEALTGDWQDGVVMRPDFSLVGINSNYSNGPKIDWVIAGGESGPGARPMHPDWTRSLRDQCADADVPFHFKQWGEFVPCVSDDEGHGLRCYPDGADCEAFLQETKAPILTAHDREFWRIGKKRAGRLLDGVEHNGMPGGSN